MPDKEDNTVLIEDARLIFRNFTGKEGLYNQEGDRNFSVLLDDDVAKVMEQDGWNIKRLRPREGDEDPHEQAYLQVSVKYRGRNGQKVRPPRIVLITSRGRTNLGEAEVEVLDFVDIITVDLIVRPYEWGVNGKGGIKAYLQSMYMTIREDALEQKYAQAPAAQDGPEF